MEVEGHTDIDTGSWGDGKNRKRKRDGQKTQRRIERKDFKLPVGKRVRRGKERDGHKIQRRIERKDIKLAVGKRVIREQREMDRR